MLLLVLDLTGDTAQADPAKDAVIEAVNRLPESTYVALLRAQDGLRVLVDPTPDRAALASAIRDLPVSGRPGLIEVVDWVQRLADDIGRRSDDFSQERNFDKFDRAVGAVHRIAMDYAEAAGMEKRRGRGRLIMCFASTQD